MEDYENLKMNIFIYYSLRFTKRYQGQGDDRGLQSAWDERGIHTVQIPVIEP
jgi:hypothetical protein